MHPLINFCCLSLASAVIANVPNDQFRVERVKNNADRKPRNRRFNWPVHIIGVIKLRRTHCPKNSTLVQSQHVWNLKNSRLKISAYAYGQPTRRICSTGQVCSDCVHTMSNSKRWHYSHFIPHRYSWIHDFTTISSGVCLIWKDVHAALFAYDDRRRCSFETTRPVNININTPDYNDNVHILLLKHKSRHCCRFSIAYIT